MDDGEKPLALARDAFCTAELPLDLPTFETDGEYGGGFDGRMSPGVEMPYHSLRGVTVMRNSFSTGDLHSLALSSHAGSTRGLLLDDAGLYKNGETPPPPPAKKEHYGGGQRTPASYQNTGSGGSPATASGAVLDRIDEVDDSQGFDRNAAKAMPSGPLGASSQWRQEAEDARRKELIQQDAVQQMLRQQQQQHQQHEQQQHEQQQQQHQHQQHGHEQQRGADADQSLDNSMNSFDISLAQMEANLLMNANSTKIGGAGSRGYFGGYMMPQQQHQQQQPLSPQQAPQYRHRPAFDVHGGGESVNPLLYGRGPVLPPPQGHYGAEHDTMQRRSALGNMGTAMPGISGSFGGGGGMRRALSTGDLSQLNGASGRVGFGVLTAQPRRIGKYSIEERQEKIRRYREKKLQRNFKKTIKYTCRKTLADSRPRVHGRFAKHVPPATPVSEDAKAATEMEPTAPTSKTATETEPTASKSAS